MSSSPRWPRHPRSAADPHRNKCRWASVVQASLDWKDPMKAYIHPNYAVTEVRCSCGNTFRTRSTKGDLHVDLCSECHPFYTGKQKLVDSGGRIDRFERRYGRRKKTS